MSSEADATEAPEDIDDIAFASVLRTGLSKEQVEFLRAYLCVGSIARAAKLSGIHRQRHFEWMKSARYVECFAAAQSQTAIALEEEARRRAINGVLEPVFQQGELVGHKRRFSDSLLAMLLEANNPEKFKVPEKQKPETPDIKLNVYIPDNRRNREPVEGEPETIRMPREAEGSGDPDEPGSK